MLDFKPTHVDTHMLTLLHPKFLEVYLKTAYQFGLPAMIPRWDLQDWQNDLVSTWLHPKKWGTSLQNYEEPGLSDAGSFYRP